MQFRRIGPEQSEQMPEKKEDRRRGEQQRVSHLRSQTGRVIGRGFPD